MYVTCVEKKLSQEVAEFGSQISLKIAKEAIEVDELVESNTSENKTK